MLKWFQTIYKVGGKLVYGTAVTAGSVAVTGGTLKLVNYWTGDKVDSRLTSCSAAPPPGTEAFTDWFRFTCESTGATCTCADVRDWLCSLDEAVHNLATADLIKEIKQYAPVGRDGLPSLQVQMVLKEYKNRVAGYEAEFGAPGEWESYDCDDSIFQGSGGRKEITKIQKRIEDAYDFNDRVAQTWADLAPEGAVLPASVSIRPWREPDDGLDASSIGMGLVLGGGLALLLLSMQPKGKSNGI